MFKPDDHVLDHVDDYLHDVLATDETAFVERHCESCPICKVALEEARKRFATLETLPTCEASEQLVRATLQNIDRHEQRGRRRRKILGFGVLLPLAASILLLTGFQAYYTNLAPTSFDLRILGQSKLMAGTPGSLRVRLVDQKNGQPVANVPVDLELRRRGTSESVKLTTFTTNAQGSGTPRFELPDWDDGTYDLHIVAQTKGTPEVLTQPVTLYRSWKLMLGSDKPIYQPGQTIHVRSLALRRPDLHPVAGRDVTFTITDPKGNVVFKRQDVTSKFGIASIDCPLATELIEGAYAIACKVGDTDSKLTVEVRKHVLPKFKIDLVLDQPYYQPGQKVKGKVQVDYFFGKPVVDGEVEVGVRSDSLSRSEKATVLKLKTDKSGSADLEYKLPDGLVGRQQDSGNARVFFDVTATDSAGQKQSKSVSRVVTSNPIHIEVIPEAGTLIRHMANKVYLFTSYADGRPAATKVLISGQEKEVETTKLGVAQFEFAPEENEASWTIRATDANGLVGRRNVKLATGLFGGDFLVRTDKAVYNGGETVKLTAVGSGNEPVFVDLIKDGQTLLTETIDMDAGKGEYAFDIPADLFGTVEMVGYRFGSAGLPVRKSRVLYIRPAQELKIETTLDKAEYRPGVRARLQFALTDAKGKPVAGAISLAAVDEAVFHVLEQAPGMERTFYLLEQQLLKPVYAIYGWDPDLTTSVNDQERREFEQALFATTAATQDAQLSPGGQASAPIRSGGNARPQPENRPLYNCVADSFPEKERLTQLAKKVGLEWTRIGWILLGFAVGSGLYACFWVFVRPIWIPIVLHGLGFVLLLGALAVQSLGSKSAMSFAKRGQAQAGVAEAVPAAKPAGAPPPMMKAVDKSAPKSDRGDANKAPPRAEPTPQRSSDSGAAAEPVRVREYFPETLLWRPELITDDAGTAHLDVELADSITTWRVSASAVAANGRLGAAQSSVRVFQPFFVDLNLPVALTRGDEVAIPVVVYNYLDKPQTVDLGLENAAWFTLLGDAGQKIELKPNEVRSLSYRLRAVKVGNQQLQVTARGSGVSDALKKEIDVVPDGRRIDVVHNGTLGQPVRLEITVPADAVEGSVKAFLKIYPSTFSQLVEGLDNIFRMPYGCFEQTSSTTYPNVLALDYLRKTKKSVPEVEAKARQFIHLGYQRLLSFEVNGGGFDWFGRAPANRTLTAYGLMEFVDMAKVHDVDPKLIERTRQWLLRQRKSDGSWPAERGMLNDGLAGSVQRGKDLDLSSTAYIAWAVFAGGDPPNDSRVTKDYLLSQRPETIDNPHTLATVTNALLAIDAKGAEVQPYLRRLDSLKRSSEDGKRVWWEQQAEARTTFYGRGQSGNIETTALVTLAFLQAEFEPAAARGALTWLTEQKDPSGTWHSTQATVLALKALVAGTGKALGGDKERRIEVAVGDNFKRDIVIPVDQGEVMQRLDLSDALKTGGNVVTVTESSGTGVGYQLAYRHNLPGVGPEKTAEPLAIDIQYDKSEVGVGDVLPVSATVVNQMKQTAPMVILDLPVPAGFAAETEDFAKLQQSGGIAKFQLTARSVIVYLRGLEPDKPLKLAYSLRATMPVKVTAPAAKVYEYYDPQKQGHGKEAKLAIK
jgi:hypothetical protein